MKLRFAILALLTSSLVAQVPAPQVPLTGNIGSGGVFPIFNNGIVSFTSDADHTMVYPETSASFIKVTSSVTLTATRNLIAPLTSGFAFTIENATSGGQSIRVIGASGTGVTIANGATAQVVSDGTNYVNTAASSAPVGTQYKAAVYNGAGSGSNTELGQANWTTDATGNPLTVPGPITGQSAQGISNTDFYTNGAGNNGISNFLAGCGANCAAAVPPTSTDTEALGSITSLNTTYANPFSIFDQRQNQYSHITKNSSLGQNGPCTIAPSMLYTNIVANCFADIRTGNLDGNPVIGLIQYTAGYGFNLGGTNPAQLPYAGGWSGFSSLAVSGNFGTRGIAQGESIEINHNGAGDTDGFAAYTHGDGGWIAPADEGQQAGVFHDDENTGYFHGTVVTGGSGATTLTTSFLSGQNAFTDEGYLLDITAGATNATFASNGTVLGYPVINYTGTLPVSTAWGTLNAGTGATANGKYQIPISQTIAVTLSTSPASPGPFTAGSNACIVGPISGGIGYPYVEQTQITNPSSVSGGVQTITFTTRYAYEAGALIMQGGICGLIATNQASSSWRAGTLAIGSFSSTQALISAPSPSTPIDNNVMVALGINQTGAVTSFYPGAEITGTNNGAPNTVTLATNTVNWTAGDTIEGPHLASISTNGVSIEYSQKSPRNASAGGWGLFLHDLDSSPCLLQNCNEILINTGVEKQSLISVPISGGFVETFQIPAASGGGNEATIHETSGPNTGHWIYGTTEGNYIYSNPQSSGGGFNFVNLVTGDVPIRASNVPKNNSSQAGQIAVTAAVGSFFEPYFKTMSGDASINYNGVVTNSGVNGAAVPASASFVGTNASGQLIAVSNTPANIPYRYVGTITAAASSTSSTLSVTGLTASNHCQVQATDASAATLTGVYEATGSGTVTLTHSSAAGTETFDVSCNIL